MTTHPLWRPYAPLANADRQALRVARRQVHPGPLQDHQRCWRVQYEGLRQGVATALRDGWFEVSHVGSTAVEGLIAKPVIDIDLVVEDAEDEAGYLPPLQAAGFRLIFRDALGGEVHRQLTVAVPNANLHVWSRDAREPRRHRLFVQWLRTHPDDRNRYAAAKRAAANHRGPRRYNDLKAATVYDIYERAFGADPRHEHDPQPRRN